MAAANIRQEAIQAIAAAKHQLNRVNFKETHIKDLFGENVFNEEVQRQRLPKPVFKALQKTIKQGAPLDPTIADAVATAMKDWAIEKGATHFTHLFQPMTGLTAEKHDSFLQPDRRRQGHRRVQRQGTGPRRAGRLVVPLRRPPRHLRGPRLHRLGPDQPRLHPGEPQRRHPGHPDRVPQLDRRGPRQEDAAAALDGSAVQPGPAHPAAVRQQRRPSKVFTTVGPEQEYFLIDKNFYYARPDLINAGRTLFGAKPPKGQELEDQYFGTIPERVLACMAEAEARAVQARRAGQDPAQRGRAEPVRDRADLRGLQPRHRPPDADDGDAPQDAPTSTAWPACCTRSRSPASTARASTTTGRCPPTPARTCSSPATRRTTTPSSWSSASRSSAPSPSIRSCCASRSRGAANDHRLGANEAPPAIISIFLGDQLQDVIDQLEKGSAEEHQAGRLHGDRRHRAAQAAARRRRPQPHQPVRLHRQQVRVPRRRRLASRSPARTRCSTPSSPSRSTTSPPSWRRRSRPGKDLNKAIQDLLPGIIKESKKVIFNGDNYTEEWHEEAEKRGLPNLQEHRRLRCRSSSARTPSSCSASTRSTASANCTAASTSCARTTSRRSTSRAS